MAESVLDPRGETKQRRSGGLSAWTRRIRRYGDAIRSGAGAFVVDNFFRSASALGRLHPLVQRERDQLMVTPDVPYRDSGSPDHHLDVYRPLRHQRPWPVVIYVHGGGFRILSKDTHWIMAIGFARRGYLVFNVNYRLAPRYPFPSAIKDVCNAFEWIVANAERYGGDLSRLAFAGESAGANLVTALAVATSYRRPEPWARAAFETGVVPQAVLPACGLLQVSDTDRFRRRRNLPWYLADRLTEVEDAYIRRARIPDPGGLDLADPLVFLERRERPDRPLPAFFIPVGTKDPILDDSRRLDSALHRLGVESEVRYYEGEVHAFHAMVVLRNARRCWTHTFDFLDRHIGPPPPTVG